MTQIAHIEDHKMKTLKDNHIEIKKKQEYINTYEEHKIKDNINYIKMSTRI